jgi:hypothetical protein
MTSEGVVDAGGGDDPFALDGTGDRSASSASDTGAPRSDAFGADSGEASPTGPAGGVTDAGGGAAIDGGFGDAGATKQAPRPFSS